MTVLELAGNNAELRKRWKPEGFQILAHERTLFRILDLLEQLPRGKALDIPAGEGGLAHCLKEMGFEVVGAEIDPGFFKARGIECLKIDMNAAMPLENESFDYIVCLEGIEHLQNPFQFIRECYRILRLGGRLILSTPNILNLASRLKYFFSGFYSCMNNISGSTFFAQFYFSELKGRDFCLRYFYINHSTFTCPQDCGFWY